VLDRAIAAKRREIMREEGLRNVAENEREQFRKAYQAEAKGEHLGDVFPHNMGQTISPKPLPVTTYSAAKLTS
jgi:hypothetical protein